MPDRTWPFAQQWAWQGTPNGLELLVRDEIIIVQYYYFRLLPSRNHFHCNVSESLIRQTADAIVSTGLKQSGYIYVVGFCLGLWFRFYST